MISVVLAGGRGTRLWPMSRKNHPKPLIRLTEDKSLVQKTFERVDSAPVSDKTLVYCSESIREPIRTQLPYLSSDDFIFEPAPRNTLPAVLLIAARVQKDYGDLPFSIFPSDHFIQPREDFYRAISAATHFAEDGEIAMLGKTPTRPETGYGYIEFDSSLQIEGDSDAYRVSTFVEKPPRDKAVELVESGKYLWNMGIYCFRPSTLFQKIEKHRSEWVDTVQRLRLAVQDDNREQINESFADIEPTSIDHGIVEEASGRVVIRADFEWSDIGNWSQIEDIRQQDNRGNIIVGDPVVIDSQNSTVFDCSDDRAVAVVGLQDTVVVDTDDAVLVVSKEHAQDLRAVVEQLEKEGLDDLL